MFSRWEYWLQGQKLYIVLKGFPSVVTPTLLNDDVQAAVADVAADTADTAVAAPVNSKIISGRNPSLYCTLTKKV